MKRIFSLLLLATIFMALQACVADCEPGGEKQYFDVRGFTVTNLMRPDTATYIGYNSVKEMDSLQFAAANFYGIGLTAEVTFHANRKSTSFGAAYAVCSPLEPGHSGSTEEILGIRITSDSIFDAAHPAGAPLNDYFMVSTYSYPSLPDDSLANRAIPLADFLADEQPARQGLQLWLTQNPDAAKQHRFTVKYVQTNGEEYILQPARVIFQ